MPNTKTKSKANQPGRIKRAVRWLKPTSPLKGMVLFALIFGVIAGGYYAYQSFASGSWSLLPGQNIWPKNGSVNASYVSTDCNGTSKGCIKVLKMPTNSSGESYVTIPASYPRAFYICVSLRAQVSSSTFAPQFSMYESSSAPISQAAYIALVVPQDKTYHEQCSGETIKAGDQTLHFVLNNPGRSVGKTSDVYVAYIALRWP